MSEDVPIAPSKSFLTQKMGPLPMWAWMGLLLGAMLAYSVARKNRAAVTTTPTNTGLGGQPLPANVVPQYTFVDEATNNFQMPPVGGRPPDPPPAPPPVPTPVPPPPTTTPPDSMDPCDPTSMLYDPVACAMQNAPPPPPPDNNPPPPPSGQWVSIIPWAAGQADNAPSTLWGVAETVYGPGQGPRWQDIWNAPQNASLVATRGDPTQIQPGDSFWVPQ